MRRITLQQIFLCTCLSGLLVFVGCGATPKGQALHSAPTQPEPKPRQAHDDGPTSAQLYELMSRLQTLEIDNAQLKKKLSDQYMEAVALRAEQMEAKKSQVRPVSNAPERVAEPSTNASESQATDTVTAADPNQFSRRELLDALLKEITDSKDPDRVKALMAAALSVASDEKQMDPRLLDQLAPKGREQVARFHQMLAVAFDELAGDATAALTRKDMIDKIDEVFGAQPLKIEQFQICRRVDSYGVYEPFETTRFLAGRKNRVLLYVELENFKHAPLDDGRHEVRLEQSVEIYDATGETTVWRQGPVELVDVSRNKRRDFFIVYPVDLPARLPAGGYRLKVRIADKHTGSLCEQTMHDIQIVADQTLVNDR